MCVSVCARGVKCLRMRCDHGDGLKLRESSKTTSTLPYSNGNLQDGDPMREPSVFDDLFSSSREILVDLDAHDTRSPLCSGKCNRAVTTAELIDYIRRADLGPFEGSCGHICRCWQPAHEALPVHPLRAREQQQLEQPKPRHPIERDFSSDHLFLPPYVHKYFPKLLGHIGINSRKTKRICLETWPLDGPSTGRPCSPPAPRSAWPCSQRRRGGGIQAP